MRTAIISDIHGNLESLTVVLGAIKQQNCDRIICLGDILGYGPDPVHCVDLIAEHCEWSLLGNHDYGALYEPMNFNVAAEQAAYWTRAQFEKEEDEEAKVRRWEFLGRLKVRVGLAFPLRARVTRRPINEYIFPEDAINSLKTQQVFERVEMYCLVKYTHVPGVFTDEPDFYPPEDVESVYKLNGTDRLIINPGSVGQPRDPSACQLRDSRRGPASRRVLPPSLRRRERGQEDPRRSRAEQLAR